MNKKKVIGIILVLIIAVAIVALVVISNNMTETTDGETKTSSSSSNLDSYDADDPSYDDESAIHITFDGSTATSDTSSGVTISDGVTKITKTGVYVLTGDYTGSVQIETDARVRIILKDVTINSTDGPAIYVLNADKTYITLDEGTTNTLTDTTNYTDQEATATIYSKDDLTFNGYGELIVTGNYQDGIISKDDLKIVSGTYNVTAMNNAIKGKDSVTIKDGTFTISAQNDGIKTTNNVDDGKGYMEILAGTFNIEAEHDGLQVETTLTISGGTFNITSGGGNSNSSKVGTQTNLFSRGAWTTTDTDSDTSESYKAIKATGDITITGGTFTIDSADDSIHSNSNVTISDATINIASGDDGIHADSDLTINSGTIDITKSYEGLEGSTVTINGGNISTVSSDDGINAAGGSDSSSTSGRPGQNSFSGSSSSYKITINDGYVYVNATGDGLDSNGSFYMNGGQLYVDGPTSNADAAIDWESEGVIKGGTIIAVGASGMQESLSSSSTVYNVLATLTSSQSSKVTVTDSSGNTIASFTPSKTYNSVVIASADLKKGETYNLLIGSSTYTSFTISSIVTTIGSSNNGGGMMNNMGR